MRILWRSTAHIFWQYPSLWLPVVLADLIAFCLRSLQGWITHAVINSLLVGHSVLSGGPEPLQTLPVAWAAVFGVSKLLVEFLNICLYATAMVAISILIPALIAQTKAPWQQILLAVKQLRAQILLFSTKVLGMLLVAVLLNIELIAYLPRLHFLQMPSTFGAMRDQGIILIALLFAAIAWLLAPSAVAILRPPESLPRDSSGLRQARIFAAISVLASAAIDFLATVVAPSFVPLLRTAFGMQFFWAVASAASALPYIPLFIAFHLIANPDTHPADAAEAELDERTEPGL
jgi:hypothetical protein